MMAVTSLHDTLVELYKSWAESLTGPQRAALLSFISIFTIGTPAKISAKEINKLKADELDRAVSAPAPMAIVGYRGVNLYHLDQTFEVGNEFADPSFTIVSLSKLEARENLKHAMFSKTTGKFRPAIAEIRIPAGTPSAYVGAIDDAAQVLVLARNTKFRVIDRITRVFVDTVIIEVVQ
jgi:hypothetical protein